MIPFLLLPGARREAASDWGLQCMRYEIRDILPPAGVRAAMELQAEAERRKRAQVRRKSHVRSAGNEWIENRNAFCNGVCERMNSVM